MAPNLAVEESIYCLVWACYIQRLPFPAVPPLFAALSSMEIDPTVSLVAYEWSCFCILVTPSLTVLKGVSGFTSAGNGIEDRRAVGKSRHEEAQVTQVAENSSRRQRHTLQRHRKDGPSGFRSGRPIMSHIRSGVSEFSLSHHLPRCLFWLVVITLRRWQVDY